MARTSTTLAAILALAGASEARAQLGLAYCTSTPNSTGGPALVALDGDGDAASNALELVCSGLPVASFGCFLVSGERASAAPFPGSSGTLCLGQPLWVDTAHVTQADALGRVHVPFDLASLPTAQWPLGIQNGDTLRFQFWYRDVAAGAARTSRLSDAVAHTFSEGAFFPAPSRGIAHHTRVLEATDLDGDGCLDFVALHREAGSISVVLARNDGTYAPATEWPTTEWGEDIATGDFDDDGHIDVAVAGGSTGTLVVHWGAGDGRLDRLERFPGLITPTAVGAGDFDGDGVDDLVVPQFNAPIAYFTSHGTGVFSRGPDIPAGSSVADLEVVDIDGDGRLDLVSASYASGYLMIRRGLGQGRFTLVHAAWIGNFAMEVAVGDVDGDGRPDMVVSFSDGSFQTHGLVRSLPGGGFSAPVRYALSGDPHALALVDLDHDGRSEVLVPDVFFLRVYRYAGGSMVGPVFEPIPDEPWTLLGLDVDLDGHLDVVSGGRTGVGLSVQLGRGDGTLDKGEPIVGTFGTGSLARGDVDGDGHEDVVILGGYVSNTEEVTLLLSRNAAFPTVQQVIINGCCHGFPLLADLDGDGDFDFATTSAADQSLTLLVNSGGGNFVELPRLNCGNGVGRIFVIDADGDGDLELLVYNHASASFSLFRNEGSMVFTPGAPIALGTYTWGVASLDVDSDGLRDLIVSGADGLGWKRSTGTGTYANVVPILTGATGSVAAIDIDGDSDEDLFAGRDELVLLRNDGAGVFRVDGSWRVDGGVGTISAVDINGDGDLDLFFPSGDFVHILHGVGDGRFPGDRVHFTGGSNGVAPVDIDLDGDVDVVCTHSGWPNRPTIFRNRLR